MPYKLNRMYKNIDCLFYIKSATWIMLLLKYG